MQAKNQQLESNMEQWTCSKLGEEYNKSVYCHHVYLTSMKSQFSHSVVSDSLRPHESEHARPPCPSPTPRVYPNPCPWSRWCHPAISSSVLPFSSCPQPLPASGSFLKSQLFAWRVHYVKCRLDESQAGIKIARSNINNLRYAEYTSLMAESEEKLKSLFMKVKEECLQAGFKTQHSKNVGLDIWSCHFMANRWGKRGNSDRFNFLMLENHYGW